MKKIVCIILQLLFFTSNCFAYFDRDANIAVMDFGTRQGATPIVLNIKNADKISCEYVIMRLVENYGFNVVDKDIVFDKLQARGLNTTGIIDPDTAKGIGDILNAQYIIYGNVTNVNVSDTGTEIISAIGGGVNVCTVKAHIVARMMDVETGDIVMMSKGDGKSKSSYTQVSVGKSLIDVPVVRIGTVTVTQDAVHNAIQKAAFAAVDNMVGKLNTKR